MNIAVDALVRSSLDGVSLLPAQRGRRPKHVPLPIQFLAALTSQETGLSASAPELVSFSLKMDSWTAQIHPKIEDVPFRTCFRLEAPGVEEDDDAWCLAFFLQAKDDKSLLVPAKEVWQTKSRALTFLKKRLKNPQEQLLADLGKASRVVPLMEKCLESARPTGLEMQTEEAYSFLRESAPLLEQNGFGVLLPSWWETPRLAPGHKAAAQRCGKKRGPGRPGLLRARLPGQLRLAALPGRRYPHEGRVRRAVPPQGPPHPDKGRVDGASLHRDRGRHCLLPEEPGPRDDPG